MVVGARAAQDARGVRRHGAVCQQAMLPTGQLKTSGVLLPHGTAHRVFKAPVGMDAPAREHDTRVRDTYRLAKFHNSANRRRLISVSSAFLDISGADLDIYVKRPLRNYVRRVRQPLITV